MITQYSKPAENPYIPQPWDMMYSMQSKKQSRIADNEQLRNAYAQQNENMRQKFEIANLEKTERFQEKALADIEESELFLANIKAYGNDNKELNAIKGQYIDRINEIATKWGDNPFKMASAVRGLKQAVKQDVMGGRLAQINDRYKKGQRMEEITDELRMKGHYDDDYYVAQKMNVFQPVGRTPDLQGEAMAFAKSIPTDSPYINNVKDLEEIIYLNMSNQFQDDKAVRLRAGRSPQEIEGMYRGIANAAANSQWQMTGKGSGSRKNGGASSNSPQNMLSLPTVTDPRYASKGNAALRKPQYTPFPVNEIESMTKYIKANGANLTWIDAETLEPSLGKDILGTATEDKDNIYAAGKVAPGSINLGAIANNPSFASPMVVVVGNKQYYVERPLSPREEGWANDVNTIGDAIHHPDGREFITSLNHSASAKIVKSKDGRPQYLLNVQGTPFTGNSPDDVYKKYLTQTN